MVIALDNDSVHTSQTVRAAQPRLAAANVELVYLARYCPEQSGIEPVWNDVTQHQIPIRSFERVADPKQAVDDALAKPSTSSTPMRNLRTSTAQRENAADAHGIVLPKNVERHETRSSTEVNACCGDVPLPKERHLVAEDYRVSLDAYAERQGAT